MQNTSATYKNIIAGQNHWFESKLEIDGVGTFYETGDAALFSVSTSDKMFGDSPEVGTAAAGEVSIVMLNPSADIPTMACLRPYVRACNDEEQSEWLPQGVFFVDTREKTDNDDGLSLLSIHGFDAMLRAEQEYTDRGVLDWSHDTVDDTDMVDDIAALMGVSVDSRTYTIMNKAYQIPMPVGYSLREVLRYIASMYVGSFIMSEEGKLRLVSLLELPPETSHLIENAGLPIAFGSVSTNLLFTPYLRLPESGVIAGIECVLNEDGSISLNGTATEDFYYSLHHYDDDCFVLGIGDYYLSDEGLGTHTGWGMYISFENESEYATTYTNNPESFSITAEYAGLPMEVGLFIPSGEALEDVVLKPMIRLDGTSDTWAEYDPALILV